MYIDIVISNVFNLNKHFFSFYFSMRYLHYLLHLYTKLGKIYWCRNIISTSAIVGQSKNYFRLLFQSIRSQNKKIMKTSRIV